MARGLDATLNVIRARPRKQCRGFPCVSECHAHSPPSVCRLSILPHTHPRPPFSEIIGFITSSPCARDTFLLEGRSLHDDPPLTLVHQSWSEDVHERKGQGGRDGASYGTRKSFWGHLRKGRENPGPGQLFTPRDTSVQTYDFYTAVLELDDFHDFCCI